MGRPMRAGRREITKYRCRVRGAKLSAERLDVLDHFGENGWRGSGDADDYGFRRGAAVEHRRSEDGVDPLEVLRE